jgi:hypothetical protein
MRFFLSQESGESLLCSCLADDDYVYTSFTSLEVSSKSSYALVLFSSFCVIVVMPPFTLALGRVYTNFLFTTGRFEPSQYIN